MENEKEQGHTLLYIDMIHFSLAKGATNSSRH